jgi:molybdate transport system ATP-binding protein
MCADLDASMHVRRGNFLLDASVRVADGDVLALLGPNGSGKTTLLRALAGHLPLESGTVSAGSRVLSRQSTEASAARGGIHVPPERRRIGLLGQEALLFPHLTAEENVAFGKRSRGVRKSTALREARDWLRSVGLADYGRRKPNELSGGQQQRVAIARALAAQPDVLLLDEPMAALDVQTAVLVRQVLHDQLILSGTTTILVTHDVLDAIVLADRIAIVQDGRIVEEGPTPRVLARPRNRFTAAVMGVNLVTGVTDADGHLLTPEGTVFMGLPSESLEPGTPAVAVFRPSAVQVYPAQPPRAEHVNQWQAGVGSLEPSSGGILVRATAGADSSGEVEFAAELSASAASALNLRAGQVLWFCADVRDVTIHGVS